MSERHIVRIDLDHVDGWSWRRLKTIDDGIAWFEMLREKAEPEYRDQIRLNWYDSYEGDGWLEIFYERPETDAEMAARLETDRQYAADQEARERRQLAALAAKYK